MERRIGRKKRLRKSVFGFSLAMAMIAGCIVTLQAAETTSIGLGSTNNAELEGLNLLWSDEFNGSTLDTSSWNYNIGYYMSDDPNTWGWGNEELEHYTNSEKNVFIQDGKLNLVAFKDPKTFPQNPNRVAPYSSGKIMSKNKVTFQYGRIDFRAKLPTGSGLWPALWLMPNADKYGTWAASGEIDVMEAKGRITRKTSGAIHYGGQWPNNTYVGGEQLFPDGQTIDSDYHVYSVVWEEDRIQWYVDGKRFFEATNEQWYSAGDPNNKNAPFDQEFYIIINLAVGGLFDGGLTPLDSDLPATMLVDYVRVYKEEGNAEPETIPVTSIALDKTKLSLTSKGETITLTNTITPSNATNQSVSWESSNPSVATVSVGQVTAVGNGTAIITATTKNGGFTASGQVSVSIAATGEVTVTNPPTGDTGSTTGGTTNGEVTGGTDNIDTVVAIPAVKNLKVKSAKTNSLKFGWTAQTDVNGYKVTLYNGTKTIKTMQTTANTATFSKLKTGNKYAVKVEAYKIEGTRKRYSTKVTLNTATSPAKVLIKSAQKSGKSVKLTWKKVSNVTGYDIDRKVGTKGKYQNVKTIGKGSIVQFAKKEKTGKTYYFKIRAYIKVGKGKVYGGYSSVKKIKM